MRREGYEDSLTTQYPARGAALLSADAVYPEAAGSFQLCGQEFKSLFHADAALYHKYATKQEQP